MAPKYEAKSTWNVINDNVGSLDVLAEFTDLDVFSFVRLSCQLSDFR